MEDVLSVGNILFTLNFTIMPLILLQSPQQEGLVDLMSAAGGKPIEAGPAKKFIANYEKRLNRLYERTRDEPDAGYGHIKRGRETMGWKFSAGLVKPFFAGLDDGDEVVILFGVNPPEPPKPHEPATHVILTSSTLLSMISQKPDGETIGYEYGTSCCTKGKSIEDCFAEIIGTLKSVATNGIAEQQTASEENVKK